MLRTIRDEVISYIREKYHIEPIRPFFRLPGNAVFCHKSSRRWFAILMAVQAEKIGLAGISAASEFVNIAVVYCGQEDLQNLMEEDGILPAYHMSRKTWITVLLDGSVKTERIRQLIDASFEKTRMRQDILSSSQEPAADEVSALRGSETYTPGNHPQQMADDTLWKKEDVPEGQMRNRENQVTFPAGYSDIPLPFKSGADERSVPEKIRQMRELADERTKSFSHSDGYIFYRQARFMETYKDDYSFSGRFEHYYPDYRTMTIRELRGYFTWRTLYRKYEKKELAESEQRAVLSSSVRTLFGQISEDRYRSDDTGQAELRGRLGERLFRLSRSRSFLFVYIFELLHGVGAESPEEGLWKILYLTVLFRPVYPELCEYAISWSRDYAVYYGLDPETKAVLFDTEFDDSLCALWEKNTADNDYFEALCRISLYDIKKSAFYKAHPEEMKQIMVKAVRRIQEDAREAKKPDLFEQAYGLMHTNTHRMFAHAVFYDYRQYEKYSCAVSGLCTFTCADGQWAVRAPGSTAYARKEKSRLIGDICRETDRIAREKTGFKHPLSQKTFNLYITGTIEKAINEFRAQKKEEMRPKLSLDMSRLADIRRDAAITCDRLITDDEQEETVPIAEKSETDRTKEQVPGTETMADDFAKSIQPGQGQAENTDPGTGSEQPGDAFHVTLSEEQRMFLLMLLRGENWRDYTFSRHLSPAVLADEINDAFMDEIGDTVLEMEEDAPEVIEDYREDVEKILGI